MTTPTGHRSHLLRELALAVALQAGLARALSRACTSAEERELDEVDHPPRLRQRVGRAG